MHKNKIKKIITDLIKVYLVYLFFDIVWPEPELRSIENITAKIFFSKNLSRFLKFGIPGYLSVQAFFLLKNDKK